MFKRVPPASSLNLIRRSQENSQLLLLSKTLTKTTTESENKNVIVFSEKRIVGYSPKQMFNVVADVESYHEFVPYCRRSVVTLRHPKRISANLCVGFRPFFNISYTSHVTLVKPYLITAVCKDVKIFDHLKTVWKFTPTSEEDLNPKECLIDFAVSFSFKSSSHSMVSKLFLDSIVRDNVRAFIDRTEQIYGPPSRKMEQKSVVIRTGQ